MVDPTVIGAGIAERIAGIEAALARQRSFVFAPGAAAVEEARVVEPADGPDDGAAGVAEHLVLRALANAADPINHRLLGQLRDDDISLAALSSRLGLSQIVTWERVSDLVQCGLVARSVEHDAIGLTGAGGEFLAFVGDAIAAATSATADRAAKVAP